MNIQQSTYGALHHKSRTKFPNNLTDNTRVFIARKGPRIVGTAFVQHNQTTFGSFEDRELRCTVDAPSAATRVALTQAARLATRHLKRRFWLN